MNVVVDHNWLVLRRDLAMRSRTGTVMRVGIQKRQSSVNKLTHVVGPFSPWTLRRTSDATRVLFPRLADRMDHA
ncbi:hypothetical protein D8W71_21290 [Rhodococcus sp. P1Y]|nr:hypothetical protein D8W71_21290 [Rhodococcus sp. P1Y]